MSAVSSTQDLFAKNQTQSLPVSRKYECNQCHTGLLASQIKRCAQCQEAIYCKKECQRAHWPAHKPVCVATGQKGATTDKKEADHPKNKETKNYLELWHRDTNQILRESLKRYETVKQKSVGIITPANDHIAHTRKFILEGAKHLDPDQSVVIVCGAQFYENRFVEPLSELLEKCKKLILIDIDSDTLKSLHSLLGHSPKVTPLNIDLGTVSSDLASFEREIGQKEKSTPEFFERALSLIEKLKATIEKRTAGLPEILGENERADYVVSSLVSSQILPSTVIADVYKKHFNCDLKNGVMSIMKDALRQSPSSVNLSKTSNAMENFSRLGKALKKVMQVAWLKHIDDLIALAGPSGNIYYADTFPEEPKMKIALSKAASDKIGKTKESIEKRTWGYGLSSQQVLAFLGTVKK